jgi:AcrR family transcriptional regulator
VTPQIRPAPSASFEGVPTDRQTRPPQQARSRASLERALQAGVEVVAEGDWNAFTTAEICRRAKVAVGSLYARFPTKEALILAVQDRILEQLGVEEQAIFDGGGWSELDAEQTIARGVRGVIETVHRNGVTIAMLMSYSATNLDVQLHGSASAQRFGEAFERKLLEHRAAFSHPNPELAVTVATRLLFDTLARRVSSPAQLSSPVSWDAFSEELVLVISAYLLRTSGHGQPSSVEFLSRAEN